MKDHAWSDSGFHWTFTHLCGTLDLTAVICEIIVGLFIVHRLQLKPKHRTNAVKYSKAAVRLCVSICIYHVVPERNCHLCMSALSEMKTIHREESQVRCAILKQKEIFNLLMLALILKLKVLAVVV